jgi:HME family heavy-metal exporter
MAVGSVVGMFVVLYMLFPSVRVTLQILNALPTAFIGGVVALVLTGQSLSVASMVGFISLGGIAARNGILLGLVPLVIDGQKPGREILYPVATVILGGLITSTFCEFLLHPGLFWRFSGRDAERLTDAAEQES